MKVTAALSCMFLLAVSADAAPFSEVQQGPQQAQFQQTISEYGKAFAEATNDMAAGIQRGKRAKAICTALKSMKVKDWVGFVTNISSNGSGYGVLAIETGKGTLLKTWNNELSDAGYNTLIKPEDPVLEAASSLVEGQAVIFSGTFFKSRTDCVEEQSLTLRGSMENPEFIFKFSKIEQLGEKYEPPKKKSLLRSLMD